MDVSPALEEMFDGSAWIDELPDGLLVCRADGTIAVVNRRLCEMAGYEREELLSTQVDRLVPVPSRASHPRLREQFVEEGRARPMGHPGADLRLARKDGVEVDVETSLSPIVGGMDRGVIAIVRDVSERNRVEAAFRTTSELLSLAHERERIARDLHDTVLQRLFGVGLELQAVSLRAPADVAGRLSEFVDEIDLIIREIRTAVFMLGSASNAGSLGQELATVVSQAKRILGFTPRLRVEGAVETVITADAQTELLASLREALTNVGRHANATEAEIEVTADDLLTLRVLDNGRGLPEGSDIAEGHGLRNMSERARRLGGDCALTPRGATRDAREARGCALTWWVPLRR